MLLLLLLPLLATASPLVPSLCGDPECNLVCEPDQVTNLLLLAAYLLHQVCLPTGTNCIMAPCCEAWQCGGQQKQPGEGDYLGPGLLSRYLSRYLSS